MCLNISDLSSGVYIKGALSFVEKTICTQILIVALVKNVAKANFKFKLFPAVKTAGNKYFLLNLVFKNLSN